MIPVHRSTGRRDVRATRLATSLAAAAAALALAGCAGGTAFPDLGVSSLHWFNAAEPGPGERIVIARDPAALNGGTDVEVAVRNAVDLAGQKRFLEARLLLAEVRKLQHRESDGYRAVSSAMALLALRDGDIGTFRRIARQLDASLGTPVRVDAAYVEVVSLFRALENRSLPVNAPEKFRRLKERFFAAAKTQT